jgi:hypothetical protein
MLEKLLHELLEKLLKKSSWGFLKYLRVWTRIADSILWRRSRVTVTWRKSWAVALVLCGLCIFFSNHWPDQPWAEFLPSGLGCEALLILLCKEAPFPARLSFWRLGFFPVAGVWLPFVIRVLFGNSDEGPFDAYVFGKLHIHVPRVSVPAALFRLRPGWMHFSPVLACVGWTICILVTARLLGTGELDFFTPAHLKAYKQTLKVHRAKRVVELRRATRSKPGT